MTELRRRKPWEESEPCLPSKGATRTKALKRKGAGGVLFATGSSLGVGSCSGEWGQEDRERRLEGGPHPEGFGFLILSKWLH